ncbi:MAG: helix-turn-helix domain-containing protein [Saccharofermentans sp.]|nr:helix-turn-helix domain-containing protein [Saccharofermentans sp.]
MPITASEKIRILLSRKNMTISDLARALDTTQSNISGKLRRDNFSEKDLQEIAGILGYTCEVFFTDNATGDKV